MATKEVCSSKLECVVVYHGGVCMIGMSFISAIVCTLYPCIAKMVGQLQAVLASLHQLLGESSKCWIDRGCNQ